MRQAHRALAGTMLVMLSVCACTSTQPRTDRAPSGVEKRQSSFNSARPGRATSCGLASDPEIERALGVRPRSSEPDLLTPGIDRCVWPLGHSVLGAKASLVVYVRHGNKRSLVRQLHAVKDAVPIPDVGDGGVYSAAAATAVLVVGSKTAGLELVGLGKHAPPSRVRAALIALARVVAGRL